MLGAGASHVRTRGDASGDRRYFERAVFRAPTHPAVRSYSLPKLHHIGAKIPLRDRAILDVGCGNGTFTVPLSELSSRTVGLDDSAHMMRELPWTRLVRGNALALPFRDSSFSIAFEANLLHHSAAPLGVLREMRRVATDYVVLVEPNRWNPLMFLFGLLVPEERGTLRSSRRHLLSLLSQADLHVISAAAMGMISQNWTPALLVPLLRRFDREFALGEYLVIVAGK